MYIAIVLLFMMNNGFQSSNKIRKKYKEIQNRGHLQTQVFAAPTVSLKKISQPNIFEELRFH